MALVQKIKDLCEQRGETLASLERKLDFGNGTIRKWDNTVPSGDRLSKVADYFGVSTDYLLGRDTENPFDGIDEETRSLARDIQSLENSNKFLLKSMIDTMKKVGKEAKDK